MLLQKKWPLHSSGRGHCLKTMDCAGGYMTVRRKGSSCALERNNIAL